MSLKISIITCTFNSEKTIVDTILSVNNQSYPNIEHIIIDGNSSDNTLNLIELHKTYKQKVISEKDNGLYDAINKGILLSKGDIIGILNSDDIFFDNDAISKIANTFQNFNTNITIADVCFVKDHNKRIITRYYSAKFFRVSFFRFGYMPPHPSFYVRKKLYLDLGLYNIKFKIAADFDLLLRYLKCKKIPFKYIDTCLVKMNSGGISNKDINSKLIINREVLQCCKDNKLYTNYLFLSSKYIYKIFGYIYARFL